MPQVIMTAIDGSLNEVLYPVLSLLQQDIFKLKNALRRSLKTSVYIVFPILVGLSVTAETLTKVLLTDKWLPCVPFMQITCAITFFWPFATRINALNALGKSNVTFKISIISKAITIFMIFLCIPSGIYAIMYGTLLSSIISFFITSYYVSRYIGYTLFELFNDIKDTIFVTVIMTIVILLLSKINVSNFIKLCIQATVGIGIYIIASELFKLEAYNYVKNAIIKKL